MIRFDNSFYQEKMQEKKDKKINYIKYDKSKLKLVKIKPDENLLKLLIEGKSDEVRAINNSLIRKHFRLLTIYFLIVFEEYFQNQKNDIKIFDEKDFLEKLKNYKFGEEFLKLFSQKSKLITMYEKFIRSNNFLDYIKNQNKNIYFSKKNIF